MAPTAQNLIDRALRLIGRLASGESPTATESADALLTLQHMLDAWAADKLMHPVETRATVSLVSGTRTYTIGASGATVTAARPIALLSVQSRDSANIDTPLLILSREQYDAISDKTATGSPAAVYLEPALSGSDSVLYVYPTPDDSRTLYLQMVAWTIEYTALSSAPELPPGYADALAYGLAIAIAPEYGIQPSQVVVLRAQQAVEAIKRLYVSRNPILTTSDFGGRQGRGRMDTPEPGAHTILVQF